MSDFNTGAIVKHPTKGVGAVIEVTETSYRIFFSEENISEISKDFQGFTLIKDGKQPSISDSIELIKDAMFEVVENLNDLQHPVDFASKWQNGELEFHPVDNSLQSHVIPISSFFRKVVLIRDRLRVLEQNINSHAVLTDEDKISLQQYVTRVYGSLTSFNFLFKNKDQFFKGESSK